VASWAINLPFKTQWLLLSAEKRGSQRAQIGCEGVTQTESLKKRVTLFSQASEESKKQDGPISRTCFSTRSGQRDCMGRLCFQVVLLKCLRSRHRRLALRGSEKGTRLNVRTRPHCDRALSGLG